MHWASFPRARSRRSVTTKNKWPQRARQRSRGRGQPLREQESAMTISVIRPSFANQTAVVGSEQLVVAGVRPIVRVLLDELVDAARSNDEARARFALATILLANGGESEGAMCTAKAVRAFGFTLDSDAQRVLYRIERHPGRSWLTHRTELRAVALNTAAETTVTDALPRLTLADLARFAREPARQPFMRSVEVRAAADALDYALRLRPRTLLGLDDEDIAVGWVARLVRCENAPTRWRGEVGELLGAFCNCYGVELYRQMRADFIRRAVWTCRRARELWQMFPRTSENACEGQVAA